MVMEQIAEAPALAGLGPPPEKRLSLFKQIEAANGNPFETLPRAVYEQPVYQWNSFFFQRLAILSDPDGVKRVLVDNVANYPKDEIQNRFFTAMFGEGLLSAPEPKWRRHRKVMAPAFDPRSVAAYAATMAGTAADFAEAWAARTQGRIIDIAEDMKALTLQLICRTMFSSDAEELVSLSADAFGRTQSALEFGPLDILPIIGAARMKEKQERLRQNFAAMDGAIYRMISARRASLADAPKDLLTRLIAATDPEDGGGMSDQEVRDEVVTIFVAGHETTAVTMTWVWYLLSQHPEAEAELHAELDAVLGDRPPTPDDLPKLVYARRVIEEAMRLYPPAPGMSRVALADDELCGVSVRAGTEISVSPWVLHHSARLWEQPLRFDPDRFSPERSAGRPRFAYMPFGGGPRVCIGAALALTEAVLILAALARRFRPRLAEGEAVELQSRITLRPRRGMRMRLETR